MTTPTDWRESLYKMMIESDLSSAGCSILEKELQELIEQVEQQAEEKGRNMAVDYIVRIAWNGAAPDTKLVNNSILEAARNKLT